MQAHPVVIEQTEPHQRIPACRLLRKSMRFTRQGAAPITQHSVEVFLVHIVESQYARRMAFS